ncbi:MAG TPA: flagellar filament capping protein FliD [Terriglobales bacterium]|nr:flagellar filament capping protein FliD [Terriglobales bacterium]
MTISLNAASLLNGNGIDVNSLVDQVQSQESGQIQVWQQEQTDLQTQATALNSINTDLTNLATAVRALSDPLGALSTVSATSSMPAILTASAQNTAGAGNHTVVVSALASQGTLYTDAIAGGADVSFLPSGATGGDLKVQVGTTIEDIPITAGTNDTLNTLASYINQQSTQNKWGVTATVLNDASGARLAIYSQNTGAPGALSLSANATTGTLYTADLSDPDSVSILPEGETSGDIQLQIGGGRGTIDDIPITAGSNDTLTTLASYINTQSTQSNWGVMATVVQDSGGYHLAITTQTKGPAGSLAFSSNNTLLTTIANPATNLKFEAAVGGTNATLTIDGIPFSSTSNTVTGAIPGVTLNLVSAEPNVPLQLSIGPDVTQASNAISTFVTAYNALVSAINQQYTVNTTTNSEGPLGSDGSLRQLQSSLLNDIAYSPVQNGDLVNLVSLGITVNDDGTLSIGTAPDGRTLNDILGADPGEVQNFFQNASNTGFANQFESDLNNLTDPSQGILNLDLAQNNTQQSDLSDEISNLQDQLATQKQQLIQEYSQVNATLEEYPYLLAEITAQLGNILPTSSNTSPNEGTTTSSSSSTSSQS